MYNWRFPIIKTLLFLSGNKTLSYLNELDNITNCKVKQKENLIKIIKHSYKNVPYYQKIFDKAGLVKNGKIKLQNFNKVPLLTKEIIKKEFNHLISKDSSSRHIFYNTSGGSTGEPTLFIQDKEFWEKNTADTLYFFKLAGKNIGEKEFKIWGSERDIFKGSIGLKEKFINFLYNRRLINSFNLTEKKIIYFIEKWQKEKPVCIWAYVDSIYEMAKYIENKHLKVPPPKSIITTAGTLNEKMRKYMENIFQCKIYNQYGSREVGAIACECSQGHGLHICEWSQYLEVVNGEIVITNLNNYSMPLIRFKIGDLGRLEKNDNKCSLKTRRLSSLRGKIMEHFINSKGDLIHSEYFTHLFYFRPWLKKYQVIQIKPEKIICKLETFSNPPKNDLADIENKIKILMGQNCDIDFKIVNKIPSLKSGKFCFTQRKFQINK